jgi:hypothetical protein
MAQNIVYLHGQPESVAHYLRLGTLHRQIETCSVQAECRWIEWLSRRRTSERLDRMISVLGDLHQTVGTTSRSASPRQRLGRAGVSASKWR